MYHIPVMVREVLEYLDIKPGMNTVDATAGRGGHLETILEKTGERGKVLGIETDPTAYGYLQKKFGGDIAQERLQLVHGNFRFLRDIVADLFPHPIHRILFDLGASLDQLQDRGRGFSFSDEGGLDMRFSQGARGKYFFDSKPAREVLNSFPEAKLREIFRRSGETQFAKEYAGAVGEYRRTKGITTAAEFAQILWYARQSHARRAKVSDRIDPTRMHTTGAPEQGKHKYWWGLHPATRAFQALRIFVNQEYVSLRLGLMAALAVLEPSGRCAVISFHSGEDRIAKRFMERAMQQGEITLAAKKPIMPSPGEVRQNPHARSARMRIFEKK